MAVVDGFRAVRFTDRAGEIADLVSPPYDILNQESYQNYLNKSPYNSVRLESPRGKGGYQTAAKLLNEWLKGGILKQDETEAIYCYEQSYFHHGKRRTLKGMFLALGLTSFDEGVVIPHEKTLDAPKRERFALMKETGWNGSPVFGLFDDPFGEIERLVFSQAEKTMLACFVDDDHVQQTLWRIQNREIMNAVVNFFREKRILLADGHHRYETALAYQKSLGKISPNHPANAILAYLAPLQSQGLLVFPTHRVLHGLSSDLALIHLRERNAAFQMQEFPIIEQGFAALRQAQREQKNAFLIVIKNTQYLAVLRDKEVCKQQDGHSKVYAHLDVTVLQHWFLDPLFEKICDCNKEEHISFTRKEQEAVEMVRNGLADAAVILSPTRVEEIQAVAQTGEQMPQKSTYFYPKQATGLVFRLLC